MCKSNMHASCMNVPFENTLCYILETQWKLVEQETGVVCDTGFHDKEESSTVARPSKTKRRKSQLRRTHSSRFPQVMAPQKYEAVASSVSNNMTN